MRGLSRISIYINDKEEEFLVDFLINNSILFNWYIFIYLKFFSIFRNNRSLPDHNKFMQNLYDDSGIQMWNKYYGLRTQIRYN